MISTLPLRFGLAGIGLAFVLSSTAVAQNTAARPAPYAIKNIRLSAGEDAPLRTILLRDGRIEAVQDASLVIPADMRVIDGEGLVATAAFVDAFTATGCEVPEREVNQDREASTNSNVLVDMRQANRKGIQPAFRASDVFALDEEKVKSHRQSGFGVVLSAPRGELLAGASVIATVRDAAPRSIIVRDDVFRHAAFSARGGGYPQTLMAFHSQLRQYFYDVEHQRELRARYDAGKPGPRPAFDAELAAGEELLDGEALVVCEADTARDVRRWLRLADEFGLKVAFSGGREIWKSAAELAERDIPVFMTLDWGKEAEDPDAEEEEEEEPDEPGEESSSDDDGPADDQSAEEIEEVEDVEDEPQIDYTYHEPLGVKREKRSLWEERRDCAVRLHEAGVRVVFCTGGGSPDDLLKNVRTLTENGFPRDAALAALTTQPAELLGLDAHFGHLRAGGSATLSLWTGDPLDEDSKVNWSFVDGFPQEFDAKAEAKGEPAEGADVSGSWELTFADDDEGRSLQLTLKMDESGKVTGSVTTENPMDSSIIHADVTGKVSGQEVNLEMTFAIGDFTVAFELNGKLKGDTISGRSTLRMPGNEEENRFEAERQPDQGGR